MITLQDIAKRFNKVPPPTVHLMEEYRPPTRYTTIADQMRILCDMGMDTEQAIRVIQDYPHSNPTRDDLWCRFCLYNDKQHRDKINNDIEEHFQSERRIEAADWKRQRFNF